MTKQALSLGTTDDDGTGDSLKTGGDKINDNFDELYGATLTASEDIAAGDFVNIHDSSGAKVRKADATDDTRPVDGYAPAAILTAASGAVVCPGKRITGLSGLTPGADYWLSETAGAITATAPSSSGNRVQFVGKAVSATELFFHPDRGVIL